MAHWARGWERTVKLVILRDGGICHLCGKAGADSADHIITRMAGGGHGMDNLKAAHKWCNSKRGAKAYASLMPRARVSRW